MDTPPYAATRLAQGKVDDIISELVKELNHRPDSNRKGPLTLLELPIDILRLIFKEITHTNDLTSLALVNSVLYSIAIPIIYSRFDIVWPDGRLSPDTSDSVDALTYGLDTLADGSTFARTTSKSLDSKLLDNDYCKYTRKFSIGNGPSEWVNDYIITKDAGKMLGTLTAIAIKKMPKLETFVWDMPTGVLSKVFGALASLADPPNDCKLSTVSVRWHDITGLPNAPLPSSENATVPAGSRVTYVGLMIPKNAKHPPPRPPVSYRDYPCEYPTFSILPPLQSLSVLEIDAVGYLDEMADLIERSKDVLQELKVGIAAKAVPKDFAQAWDGPDLKQIDHDARFPGASTIGDRRLGGVLGILVSKFFDIRQHRALVRPKMSLSSDTTGSISALSNPAATTSSGDAEGKSYGNDASASAEDSESHEETGVQEVLSNAGIPSGKAKLLDGKLRLRVLALERISLSIHVCMHAFDVTCLTHLTLLDCAAHEHLWKMLHKQYKPTNMTSSPVIGSPTEKQSSQPTPLIEYHLSLKYLHTDATTPALILFIKETLAPNTLEVLFLQDRKKTASPPPVPLNELFNGAIKRHVMSLRKLLIDSSAKPTVQGSVTIAADNTRWRHWTLSTEVMQYISSGRMSRLRELSVALQYKDWHKFLTRLPNLSELRSFHMHHMLDYIGGAFDPKEMANQITDIVTLRPEIKLCYMGLGNKCYELLEVQDVVPPPDSAAAPASSSTNQVNGTGTNGVQNQPVNGGYTSGIGVNDDFDTGEIDDEEAEDTSAEEDEEEDDDDGDIAPLLAGLDQDDPTTNGEVSVVSTGLVAVPGTGGPSSQPGASSSSAGAPKNDDEVDDGWVEPVIGGVRLKMREILFYDDKVAIFKARHGRL